MNRNAGDAPIGPVSTEQATGASILARLGASAESGLSLQDVQARLARDGANEVLPKPHHPVLAFARKFWGLSAWMIELIVILSWALGKYTDFAVALGFSLSMRCSAMCRKSAPLRPWTFCGASCR